MPGSGLGATLHALRSDPPPVLRGFRVFYLEPARPAVRSPRACCVSGGVAADQLFNWGRATHHFWAAVAVLLCGGMYIVLGFFPYMDNFGHIFGMFAGFLITTCFLRSAQVRGRRPVCGAADVHSLCGHEMRFQMK